MDVVTPTQSITCTCITCNTPAPHCKNCSPTSAESIPPAARIGNPGRCLPMLETSLKAIGFMVLPDMPPYVVFFSLPTEGQAEPSVLIPIRPDTVLIAVTPSAPPGV